MRILLFTIIFLQTWIIALAQADSLQREINEQVWKPFIKSFNERDNKAFRAVHSKDLIRVSQDPKHIYNLEEYLPENQPARQSNAKRTIELRFIQRIAANGKGFEVGYYKTSSTNLSTGKTNISYGKFHVLLRKEANVWKILMDADAHEGTNEDIFMKAAPME